MGKNKITTIFYLLIFLSFFSSSLANKNMAQIINDYNTIYYYEPSNYNEFDIFYEGIINKTQTVISYTYKLNLTNNTELGKIFFDYQSDFGKLNISFNKGCSEYIIFNASDKNNFFVLDLNDILNQSSLDDYIDMEVQVSHENIDSDFDFDFSLKVSLKKSINILEINSEHPILCQTEKVEDQDKYRCLFVYVNNNKMNLNDNEENLLIFPMINENIDELNLNIYADYINKSIYDDFDKETLHNLIPNESSKYINKINGTKVNFIRIENINYEKYIYISIETNKETLLEILSQEISENQKSYELSGHKKIQTFSINELNTSITLNLTQLKISEISLQLTTIYGKSTIYFDGDVDKKYTTDIRENNLLLSLDSDKKKLIFDKIDGGHIFYISIINNSKNILNELIYGTSSRFSFNKISDNILFYEKIPLNNDSININLQLYNDIKTKNLSDRYYINVTFLSKEEIHEIKYNSSLINELNFVAEGELNPYTFSTNIHLDFNLTNNKTYALIKLTPNFDVNDKIMILGITLSKVNSLIYPAERIYHFGELNKYEKITYRLKGQEKYHLMRLEFGHNSGDIKWSVKRNYDEKNYTSNDTDISFVIEYWHNGRELLTMYIENGEDIYLTIFKRKPTRSPKLLSYNYAFKYINSGKNGDFKNYIVKNDYLTYEEKDRNITITELWNKHPHNVLIKYYMRLIETNNYITSETLNSISLIESKSNFSLNSTFTTDKETSENVVVFSLRNSIDLYKNYNINCYIAVIEDNNDIELLSYAGSYMEGQKLKKPVKGLIIASLCITGVVFIILLIRFIHHCTCAESYYTRKKKNYKYNYLI